LNHARIAPPAGRPATIGQCIEASGRRARGCIAPGVSAFE